MLFTAFKKKIRPAQSILGMLLLESEEPPGMDDIIRAIGASGAVKEIRHHDERCMLVARLSNYKLTLAHLRAEVFGRDLEYLARNSYPSQWKSRPGEHKSHLMVTLSQCGSDPLRENELYTRLIKNLFGLPSATGIYLSERRLLLSKPAYLQNLESDRFPVSNWIFFGSHQSGELRSAYTYGLTEFGKPEIEILDSTHNFFRLARVLEDTVCYLLSQNAALKAGERLRLPGLSELTISQEKGVFVAGKCMRIHF